MAAFIFRVFYTFMSLGCLRAFWLQGSVRRNVLGLYGLVQTYIGAVF